MLRLSLAVLLLAGCTTFVPLDPVALAKLEPLLGELLLVGFDGTEGDANVELDALVCDARVGGVLLFGRNVVDAVQVRRLTTAMRTRAAACRRHAPPLVAVDAEGGRVMRLGPRAGYVPTPSAQEMADENDVALTELEARRIGRMLREAGIRWNLAPVVDVGSNPANAVIVGAGRSYGATPAAVVAHARAFLRGLHAEGVLGALKHFPGHGSSWADSHVGFVDVTATADHDVELLPYRVLIGERIVDAVMTAHVFNRRLDRRYPATLSYATITQLLRRDIGWDGAVVSDDLRMGAIEQHWGLAEAVVLALEAGVDVLLIAEDRLPDGRSAASVARTAI
ncbi:MAG TPA: glycoside hydrolase family 3 N-terminal domain-containing protein, partial [Terriglobales bacterium]|nr:glycoside hydrolase family 3 N-terminal domain-containing protein [Terriglobales bacterium]